jgi:hypothetical protein
MRRHTQPRRKRAELAWFATGFLGVQLALGIGVDQLWPVIRDPEVEQELRDLWQHRPAAPTCPLVVALGSSRTKFGLRADLLNQVVGSQGPVVYNLAIPASGPLFQQIVLRRLLAEGLRPQLVFLEVMPLTLSRRGGTPLEEHWLDSARLDAKETARVYPYYHQVYKALCPWIAGRMLPVYRHQAELRDSLGLDVPAGARSGNCTTSATGPRSPSAEHYGWLPNKRPATPAAVQSKIQSALGQYDRVFADQNLEAQPARALRDLLAYCCEQGVAAVLVMPPESQVFRNSYRAAYGEIEAYISRVASAFGVPLYDARTWVEDEGFSDGHHLCVEGADQFTAHFEREVLRPALHDFYTGSGSTRDNRKVSARPTPLLDAITCSP